MSFEALFSFEGTNLQVNISGGNGAEVTPVPIPNTEVKLCYAENTWWVTAREDKSPPEYIQKTKEYSSKFGREYMIYSGGSSVGRREVC